MRSGSHGVHRQCVVFALVGVAVAGVIAHHGWSGNAAEETTLTGTLEAPVSLTGPHATMKINVDGQVWDVTLAPPWNTKNAGLRDGVIPVGATVTVRGHRSLVPNRYEIKTESVTWNKRVFDVYPNRKH